MQSAVDGFERDVLWYVDIPLRSIVAELFFGVEGPIARLDFVPARSFAGR
jgi:hypothetical protein